MSDESYTPSECPTCKGDGAVYEQVRVGQSATPFVCKQCDGDGEVRADPPTPTVAEVKRIFSAHALKSDRERLSAEFDRFITRIKEDARAGALIRGAEIGWDAAVNAMQFEDGTKPETIEVVNPYRPKEGQ